MLVTLKAHRVILVVLVPLQAILVVLDLQAVQVQAILVVLVPLQAIQVVLDIPVVQALLVHRAMLDLLVAQALLAHRAILVLLAVLVIQVAEVLTELPLQLH